MQRESKFSIRFRHWIKAHRDMFETCSFEAKQTTTDSINFNKIEQGQIDYAESIAHGKGIFIRVIGNDGEPDYIFMKKNPAYIVIEYPDCDTIIHIDDFLKEKNKSKRKSLTSERARAIATHVIE